MAQATDLVAQLRVAPEEREGRVGHLLTLGSQAAEMPRPLASEQRGHKHDDRGDQQHRADHPPIRHRAHPDGGNGNTARRQTSGAPAAGKTICYSSANESGDVILAARIPSMDAAPWV